MPFPGSACDMRDGNVEGRRDQEGEPKSSRPLSSGCGGLQVFPHIESMVVRAPPAFIDNIG